MRIQSRSSVTLLVQFYSYNFLRSTVLFIMGIFTCDELGLALLGPMSNNETLRQKWSEKIPEEDRRESTQNSGEESMNQSSRTLIVAWSTSHGRLPQVLDDVQDGKKSAGSHFPWSDRTSCTSLDMSIDLCSLANRKLVQEVSCRTNLMYLYSKSILFYSWRPVMR